MPTFRCRGRKPSATSTKGLAPRCDSSGTTRPPTICRPARTFSVRVPRNGPGSIFVNPTADGISILSRIIIPPSLLNEDNGWYEGAGDEIYARLRFVAGNGQEVTDDSNVVKGEF